MHAKVCDQKTTTTGQTQAQNTHKAKIQTIIRNISEEEKLSRKVIQLFQIKPLSENA